MTLPGSVTQSEFLVPEMHCAGCLRSVEKAMLAHPAVNAARANLTARSVAVTYDAQRIAPTGLITLLDKAGFKARQADAAMALSHDSRQADARLLRALAVAGFAAANVMLLSVSVWAGADDASRSLFHWLSAMIALPAVAYAGRPFFASAWPALRAGRLNMDVPISLAVVLATAMSLYQTMIGAQDAWFDASLALLFFLLAGRVLDQRMRGLTRQAAARLLALAPDTAHVVDADGAVVPCPARDVRPGQILRVMPGQQVPLDGIVISGISDIDRSSLTGEPLPEAVSSASQVHAGTMNLTGVLDIRVTRSAPDTLLAGIVRLMRVAETGRGAYVALADRAAALYAPLVHLVAAMTLAGWMLAGASVYDALSIAIAVLIITCPCALGLAVPAAQVVASGVLMKRGILLKDGGALERLAGVGHVFFDKTGTLTLGVPVLSGSVDADTRSWSIALGLAEASRHPLAVALAGEARRRGVVPATLTDLKEEPGCGISGRHNGEIVRLGKRAWAAPDASDGHDEAASHVWLGIGVEPAIAFSFIDAIKADAGAAIEALGRAGLDVALLSGDRRQAVAAAARQAGIGTWSAEVGPAEKIARVQRLQAEGRHVLMVGDGINDAPALAAADVSMAPASGSDITQAAADIVFTGDRLLPVLDALVMARRTRRVILQNFMLAGLYNAVAIPVAVAGYATPLLAAIAMSSSSILVTANALRLSRAVGKAQPRPHQRAAPARKEEALA